MDSNATELWVYALGETELRRPRQQLRPAQARHMQRTHRRISQPTQGQLHRILKIHPGSYLLRTWPRTRPFRAILHSR